MKTVRDIKKRAVTDMRQRLYNRGLFQRSVMRKMAKSLARDYSAGLSAESLLALARHDSWLKEQRMHGVEENRETIRLIQDKLEGFLRRELRLVVSSFWEGRTSMELAVKRSGVELVGFFNQERPVRPPGVNDPFEDMLHNQQQSPYA
jgi:hypothetical protein